MSQIRRKSQRIKEQRTKSNQSRVISEKAKPRAEKALYVRFRRPDLSPLFSRKVSKRKDTSGNGKSVKKAAKDRPKEKTSLAPVSPTPTRAVPPRVGAQQPISIDLESSSPASSPIYISEETSGDASSEEPLNFLQRFHPHGALISPAPVTPAPEVEWSPISNYLLYAYECLSVMEDYRVPTGLRMLLDSETPAKP